MIIIECDGPKLLSASLILLSIVGSNIKLLLLGPILLHGTHRSKLIGAAGTLISERESDGRLDRALISWCCCLGSELERH